MISKGGVLISLVKKLQLKANMQISFLHAPKGFKESLGELPPGLSLIENPEPGTLDAVILFVKSLGELEAEASGAVGLAKYDALVWIAYPKKTSKIKTDINRDTGWVKMQAIGYEGVAMVAIDNTWSAMRYRPAARVGK